MEKLLDIQSRTSLRKNVCWPECLLLQELQRSLDEAEIEASEASICKGTTIVAARLCNVYDGLASDYVKFQLATGDRISASGAPVAVCALNTVRLAVQDGPRDGFVSMGDVVAKMKITSGPTAWARGPHARSNWLPIGEQGHLQLCVGGWPFRLPGGYGIEGQTEEEGQEKIKALLLAGITTFVNTTHGQEFLLSTSPESSYDYWWPQAALIAADIFGGTANQHSQRKMLSRIDCPMPDEQVTTDEELATLLDKLLTELQDPQRVLYVHCYGGHGRTGVTCCSLLCLLYPHLDKLPTEVKEEWAIKPIRNHVWPHDVLDNLHLKFTKFAATLAEGAVAVFNRFHAARELEHGGGCIRFPHSKEQLEQVARVAQRSGPFASLWASLAATETSNQTQNNLEI